MENLPRVVELGRDTPEVCRLGLATRGNTHLTSDDVHCAVAAGVNYLNWCGHVDGMSRAVREFSPADRRQVVVAKQFFARTAVEAREELSSTLDVLKTDYIDCLSFYYVESPQEWSAITGPDGALEELVRARDSGAVRLIGITTHQRHLVAEWIQSGHLDFAMVRYNAAHRGAEEDVFPVAEQCGVPIVAFTCQRWGALIQPTLQDPAGYSPLPAREWDRFVLAQPTVSVALMAPKNGAELEEDLALLEDWQLPTPEVMEELRAHGLRVRGSAGGFP